MEKWLPSVLERGSTTQRGNEFDEAGFIETASRPTKNDGIGRTKVVAELIVLVTWREITVDPVERRVRIALNRT